MVVGHVVGLRKGFEVTQMNNATSKVRHSLYSLQTRLIMCILSSLNCHSIAWPIKGMCLI